MEIIPQKLLINGEPTSMMGFHHPAVCIAFLAFHHLLHEGMVWEAGVERDAEGRRLYDHAMSCDAAIRAQARMPVRGTDSEGYKNVMVGLMMGDDKCDTGRTESTHPMYIKVNNGIADYVLLQHMSQYHSILQDI